MLPAQDLSQSNIYWEWMGREDVEFIQHVGLKDKSGKEIYEGDLCQSSNKDVFLIKFGNYNEGRMQDSKITCGFYMENISGLRTYPIDGDLLIIGNRFIKGESWT